MRDTLGLVLYNYYNMLPYLPSVALGIWRAFLHFDPAREHHARSCACPAQHSHVPGVIQPAV